MVFAEGFNVAADIANATGEEAVANNVGITGVEAKDGVRFEGLALVLDG